MNDQDMRDHKYSIVYHYTRRVSHVMGFTVQPPVQVLREAINPIPSVAPYGMRVRAFGRILAPRGRDCSNLDALIIRKGTLDDVRMFSTPESDMPYDSLNSLVEAYTLRSNTNRSTFSVTGEEDVSVSAVRDSLRFNLRDLIKDCPVSAERFYDAKDVLLATTALSPSAAEQEIIRLSQERRRKSKPVAIDHRGETKARLGLPIE
jgi:hypothetical protein